MYVCIYRALQFMLLIGWLTKTEDSIERVTNKELPHLSHGKNQRASRYNQWEKHRGGSQGTPGCSQGFGLYPLDLLITFPVGDSLKLSVYLMHRTYVGWGGAHLSGSPWSSCPSSSWEWRFYFVSLSWYFSECKKPQRAITFSWCNSLLIFFYIAPPLCPRLFLGNHHSSLLF